MARGRTTRSMGHDHAFQINISGDGKTSRNDKHFHTIKDKKVQMAGKHTHRLRRPKLKKGGRR